MENALPFPIYNIHIVYFVLWAVFPCVLGKMHCKKLRGVGVRRIKTLLITFSLVMLEFFVRMIYNNCYSVCACSSVDRAPASGAGCVGSIPVRRTKNGRTYMSCRFSSIYKCITYTMPRRQQASASYFPHCENPLETVQERKAYRTSPNIP